MKAARGTEEGLSLRQNRSKFISLRDIQRVDSLEGHKLFPRCCCIAPVLCQQINYSVLCSDTLF